MPIIFFFDDSISRLRSPVIQKNVFAKKRYTSIASRGPMATINTLGLRTIDRAVEIIMTRTDPGKKIRGERKAGGREARPGD